MRLAKSSITVIALLALLAGVNTSLRAQTQPPAKPSQPGKQPAKAAAQVPKAGPQPGKTSPAAQPAQAPAKAKQQPSAKAKQQPGKAASGEKPVAKAAPKAKGKKPAKAEAPAAVPAKATIARRDPFDPLVGRQRPGGELPERLPPGKAGLIVSTLRLDGTVRGPNGMIAVVSNPQQRVYFLREGDQLYDGRVEHITMDAVSFHEVGKDAFGKPVDRQVTKRLYPSPGEQR